MDVARQVFDEMPEWLNGMWTMWLLNNMHSFMVYSLNRLDYEVVDVLFDNRRTILLVDYPSY